ncbi:hypothetical protein GBAR_LOCUS15036, partial [Geodia barretti]
MNIKAPTATSKCQLTTSEDAWVVLATAILPGYRVKVHKCTSLCFWVYIHLQVKTISIADMKDLVIKQGKG